MFKNFVNKVSGAFDINKATLTGCIDIIAVEREDGSLHSSPFHVRFGKLKVLRTKEKRVNLLVNGKDIGVFMKLGKEGEGYFEIEADLADDDSEINSDSCYFGSDEENDEELEEKRSDGASPNKKGKRWFWGSFPRKQDLLEQQRRQERSAFMKKLNNIFSRASDKKAKQLKPIQAEPNEGKEGAEEVQGEEAVQEEDENQVGLSLCKSLISVEMSDEDLISVFDENILDFESFATFSREYLTHPELMIRIHDSLYLPEDGIPQIISLLAYNRVLDQNSQAGEQEPPEENNVPEMQSPSKR